ISVMANAVVHRGSEASVWVVLDGNRFVRRGITTDMLVRDMLQVTDGLQAGERVVTHARSSLTAPRAQTDRRGAVPQLSQRSARAGHLCSHGLVTWTGGGVVTFLRLLQSA
ncbi:MAG TPA: hypothetical protein VEX11_03365, partial [Acetobacteraceae bacterium]|nr:hypothetical protein [Acetobacteraceae bacterium]